MHKIIVKNIELMVNSHMWSGMHGRKYLWLVIMCLDSTLEKGASYVQVKLTVLQMVAVFMQHCYRLHQYICDTLKCGSDL